MYNPLGTDDENTYYEQYNTVCSGVIKTGDFVYVVTDGGKQILAQVDTIWETGELVRGVIIYNTYNDSKEQLILCTRYRMIITKRFYVETLFKNNDNKK